MSTSTMLESRHHVRSISMPSRSHPNTARIKEELRKLKNLELSSSVSKAATVSVGLVGLGELYKCVEDLLQLPLTQQGIVHNHQHEKWVDDVLDGSVRLLDVCGTARDILSQMKENAADLRSALRRRGDESCKEEKVDAYVSSRKKMNKCINKCLGDLKKIDRKFVSSPIMVKDRQLEMVITVLREVRAVTVSIFQCSLLAFMSEPKPTKWSLVSKLMQKGQVRCMEEHDAMECVDAALRSLCRCVSSKYVEVQNVQSAQKSLEALEVRIEGVEVGLGNLSRRLIQTRVSLLNIFTQ